MRTPTFSLARRLLLALVGLLLAGSSLTTSMNNNIALAADPKVKTAAAAAQTDEFDAPNPNHQKPAGVQQSRSILVQFCTS